MYKFENLTLELSDAKGTLFSNGKLVFKGFGYTAIQEYIRASGNNPEAKKPAVVSNVFELNSLGF